MCARVLITKINIYYQNISVICKPYYDNDIPLEPLHEFKTQYELFNTPSFHDAQMVTLTCDVIYVSLELRSLER